MKVRSIEILCGLEELDIENSNVDICVTTEEGFNFNLTCTTPKNIEFLMEKEELDYQLPGHPTIIVRRITKKNIEKAVQAYAQEDNGYWLELYHFAHNIDPNVFDQLKAKRIQQEKEWSEFSKLDHLLKECKKLAEALEELIKLKEHE